MKVTGFDNGRKGLKSVQEALITTKLHIPRLNAPTVHRMRLFACLDEGLRRKCTLLAAPAGYGKTTLLSEWASGLAHPVAWISLDEGDQDRLRFWRYNIRALSAAISSFPEAKLVQLATADAIGDSLIAGLIAALGHLDEPLTIVWDDFHHLCHASFVRSLNLFLQRLPPQVHVYVASREIPPLALAKLSAQGEAAVLDAEAIRFTKEETNELLQICGLWQTGRADVDIAALYEQTEGWAVGIRLMALSLSAAGSQLVNAKELAGPHGPISDFLFEEVFVRLPARQQQFLLHTSHLRRMDAALCQAVTGMTDSASMLQALARANLFLVALDDKREWVRYHHAFRQFLIHRLQINAPDRIAGLHLAAGKWLEGSGDWPEAVEHYLAGGHFAEGLALVAQLAPSLMQGEWTTLRHWLDQVPLDWIFRVPQLYFIYIGALYMDGKIEESTAKYWWADEQLRLMDPDQDRAVLQEWQAGLAFLVAMRAYIERDFATFLTYSRQYLALRPAGDFLVGFGIGPDGRHLMWETLATNEGLRKAQEVLPEIWSLWSETDNVYLIAHFSIDYGKWHYERNELQEAEVYFRRALDIGEDKGNACLAIEAAIGIARIELANARPGRADALLSAVRSRFGGERFPMQEDRLRWFEAVRAIVREDREAAAAWHRECGLLAEDEIIPAMLDVYDTAACALAAQGRTEEAIVLLNRLIDMALRLDRRTDVIRLRVHRSLLLELSGESSQSLRELEEALSWAESDGCIRTIADAGSPLRRLLERYAQARRDRRLRPHPYVSMAYVRKLLRHMLPDGVTSETIELTYREATVMQYMTAGLSNREIADQMGISVATVKSHVNHIYRKMNISGRSEGLRRAAKGGMIVAPLANR